MKTTKHVKCLFVCLFSGILFLSCNIPDHSSSIDLSINQNVSVFDVFSDVEVIKLETSENSMISQIKRVLYYDFHYYILDMRSQQILCFANDGSFVYKIDSQGKGPGEYHYIQDFTINKENKQVVALDPVVQKVHFFGLDGNFLHSHDIKSEQVLGLNRVYSMKDSLLLLISNTYERLQIYSLKEGRMVYADFNYPVPSTLHAFSPKDNIFFFDEKVLFLIPLSREIVDISSLKPEPYFTWDFGVQNNSDKQIKLLLDEIRIKQQIPEYITLPYEVVGANKILNHHIMKTFENKRFRVATLEFDNNFKFVVTDKTNNRTSVFESFQEGVLFPFEFMQFDRAIVYAMPEIGPLDVEMIKREGMEDYYLGRNFTLYTTEILKEDCRKIIESHNPMTDNPFLVVYRFKE